MIAKYLSQSLLMTESDLIKFAKTAPHRYKVYEIKKRNSTKTRTIAHPSKELKFIQRILADFLSKKLPVHETAFAYKKQLGIKDNANKHLNSKYLLKMDFNNFFPSITPSLFFGIAKKHGIEFNETDKIILSWLLFWKSKKSNELVLSIGAPSSPLISNFVMYFFDQEMTKICMDQKITYTRYADDITLSTNVRTSLFSFPEIVANLLADTAAGIELNKDKTTFSSQAHNRHVTGITLTNDGKLSVGRERKRLISSMIHKSKFHVLSTNEASKLLGILSHATHIEPDFLRRMEKKYGKETLEVIKKKANE